MHLQSATDIRCIQMKQPFESEFETPFLMTGEWKKLAMIPPLPNKPILQGRHFHLNL